MESRRKRPRSPETETTSSETTNTNGTNAVNPQNVAPIATAGKSWVDDSPPDMNYSNFLTDLTVDNYLRFSCLPKFLSRSPEELKKTIKNFEELEQTMKNFLENGEILSFAPILLEEKESKEKTILVKLKPPSKRPEYSDLCPLLELKVTHLLPGLPIPPTVMFRFQVPSCGYSPIPGTTLLFEDAKKAYDKLIEEKGRSDPMPPIPTRGRHALYRMVLPTGLQAEPFADGESVQSLLAPDTTETPAPWRAMNLPRLRRNRLNIAVAFREKLATMQREGYFSKFNFKILLQWLDECMNRWGEELNSKSAAPAPAPAPAAPAPAAPARTVVPATPAPAAPAAPAPARMVPATPAPAAPAAPARMVPVTPAAAAPEAPARTAPAGAAAAACGAAAAAAAPAPLAPAQPAGTPRLQRFFASQSPNSSQSTLSPTAPGQRSASPSSR